MNIYSVTLDFSTSSAMKSSTKIIRGRRALYIEDSPSKLQLIRVDGKYYHPDTKTYEQIRDNDILWGKLVISDDALPLCIEIALIFAGLLLSLLSSPHASLCPLPLSIIFIVGNVAMHELAHALVLHFFYPAAKIGIGFKFTFIFPTFYVDTSDSYLLPTYKRMAVYLAGNAANAALLLIVCLGKLRLGGASDFVLLTMITNLAPIMKSDGYYAIAAATKRYNLCQETPRRILEDCIRGLAILLISCVVLRFLIG